MDVQGGVDFAERLLTCGSDAEILSAKAVTLKRLGSLAEGGRPASVAPDDGSGISFAASEPAGQVGGFPVVGAIVSKTVEVSKCTIEGEGRETPDGRLSSAHPALKGLFSSVYICGRTSRSGDGPPGEGWSGEGCLHAC